MTDKQIIKRYRKREKELGVWSAENSYDAWDIFIGEEKWTRLVAVTKNPIKVMNRDNLFTNIDWNTVKAVKLT